MRIQWIPGSSFRTHSAWVRGYAYSMLKILCVVCMCVLLCSPLVIIILIQFVDPENHQRQGVPKNEVNSLSINEVKDLNDYPFTVDNLGINDLIYKGKDMKIAIIDQGFHPHESLSNAKVTICEIYMEGEKFNQRPLEYSSLENDMYQTNYCHCHATAVAGIAVGKPFDGWDGKNNSTIKYPGGVAPEAELKVFIIKADGEESKAHGYLNYALELIAEDNDTTFDVVSMSLRVGDQHLIEQNKDQRNQDIALKRGSIIYNIKKIRRKGTHVLATSTNTGELTKNIEFPAQLDCVISIGSLAPKGELSYLSKRTGVDYYCCGEVRVPCYVKKDVVAVSTNIEDGHRKVLQDVVGSSFAAPAFAGLICLIMQHVKKENSELIKNFWRKQVLLKAANMGYINFFKTDKSSLLKIVNEV